MSHFIGLTLCAALAAQAGASEGETAAPSASSNVTQWSQFRGPQGRGSAASGQALPSTLDPAVNLRWKCALPQGNSSACLWNDRIFVTGYEDEELLTLCIERASGEVLWRRALACPEPARAHRINTPASSTTCTDGERVYAYFGSFGLVCYDFEGSEVWRREVEVPENIFGTAASPVLAKGKLIFVSDANDGSYVEAIEPASGETLWRTERKGQLSGWSTPTLWQRDGVDELLVYGNWWMSAYDLSDGSMRWSVPGLADEPIVMPAVGSGLVFVSSYNMGKNQEVIGLPKFELLLEQHDGDDSGDLSRAEAEANESVLSRFDGEGEGDHPLRIFFRFLDADKDGAITASEYTKLGTWLADFEHINGVVAIRPARDEGQAEIAWQYPRGVPECPSPLYHAGRLYLVKNGGIATCLDAASGELIFTGRLGSRGPHYASPVLGDGKIYCASAAGVVAIIKASSELEVLSLNDLGERIMATPALSNGVVYVRGEEHLFAFGE